MNSKKTFYTELSFVLGIVILAFGTAFMERADFGMSMVVAPAYIFHLKISQFLPFFTFGMAEYSLQLVLILLITLILRRFRLYYLFSFVTAVIYGFTLDAVMLLISLVPPLSMVLRLVFFLAGMLLCSLGVALLFHTYIAPEAYELLVKEIAGKYKKDIHVVKTIYDVASCLIAVVLSFCFFGLWHFEGVKAGTVVCALVNGFIISLFTKLLEKGFTFKDSWKLRKYFES